MEYTYKLYPELLWAVAVALIAFLAQIFVVFDPSAIDNWEAWATAFFAGAARAAAAAVLAFLPRLKGTT